MITQSDDIAGTMWFAGGDSSEHLQGVEECLGTPCPRWSQVVVSLTNVHEINVQSILKSGIAQTVHDFARSLPEKLQAQMVASRHACMQINTCNNCASTQACRERSSCY